MLTEEERDLLNIISWSLSGLSCVSIIISLCFYLFSKQRSFRSFRVEIIVWLIMTSFFELLASFFPIGNDNYDSESGKPDLMCKIQSIINTVFGYSSSIWTALIGYIAFINVIKPEHIDQYKWNYRGLCLGLSFGIPIIMAVM